MTYSMHDKEVLHETAEKPSDCKITLKNPNGEVVKEHALGSDNHMGALAHSAQISGEHSVCMKCQAQDWLNFGGRKMRWSIAFDILGGEAGGLGGAPDPARLASLAHLKGAQAGVEELVERLQAISSENDYEKYF